MGASRPPYLPEVERKTKKMAWPNPFERRFWALVLGYSLTTVSIGPILALVPLYFSNGLGVPQAELGRFLWAPPFAWAVGYFFWGWAADRYASGKRRPVGMLVLLTVLSLPIGGFIHQGDIQKAIGYCDSLMPLLQEEKNKTGSYPVDLQGVLKNRARSPYLLSFENYYLSDGLSFVFSFSERDGVFPHVNLYSSERKKWEKF